MPRILLAPLIVSVLVGCSKSDPAVAPATPEDAFRGALARFDAGDVEGGVARVVAAYETVAETGVQPQDSAVLRELLARLLPIDPNVLPPSELVDTTLALAALEGMDAARTPLAAWVDEHPDAFSALLSLGLLARTFDHLDPARAWFERAAAAAPERTEPHFELGTLAAAAGDLEEALARFDAVLERAPGDPRGRYYRARALQESGREDEAFAEWQDLAAGTGEFASRSGNEVGAALLTRGDQEGALAAFVAATAAAPDRAAPHLNAGSLLTDLGRGEDAVPYLERAHGLRPDDPRPSMLLGRVHEDAERTAEAEAAYREALRRAPSYESARYRLSLLLRRAGREAEADAIAADRGS